jgi:hypothetical protein
VDALDVLNVVIRAGKVRRCDERVGLGPTLCDNVGPSLFRGGRVLFPGGRGVRSGVLGLAALCVESRFDLLGRALGFLPLIARDAAMLVLYLARSPFHSLLRTIVVHSGASSLEDAEKDRNRGASDGIRRRALISATMMLLRSCLHHEALLLIVEISPHDLLQEPRDHYRLHTPHEWRRLRENPR